MDHTKTTKITPSQTTASISLKSQSAIVFYSIRAAMRKSIFNNSRRKQTMSIQ